VYERRRLYGDGKPNGTANVLATAIGMWRVGEEGHNRFYSKLSPNGEGNNEKCLLYTEGIKTMT